MGIVSKAYYEAAGEEGAGTSVGTGPYVLDQLTPGSEISMTLCDDILQHWRVEPDFERVVLRVAPECTRVAMLQAGEADIAPISFDSIPTVSEPGLDIVSAEATWSPVVRFGGLTQTSVDRYNADAPWAKKEVRQALNYAVDKQTTIDELFQGEAAVAPATRGFRPGPQSR